MKKTMLFMCSALLLTACNNTKKEKTVTEKTTTPLTTDFIASGENPSWELLIDLDKSVHFTSSEEPKSLTTEAPKAHPIQDAKGVTYNVRTETEMIQVNVFRENCNTTSQGTLPYKVRVRINTPQMGEYVTFEGCGKYLGNYRLNDIWALETIDGNEIDKSMKRPNLEFNLRENKVFGFSGCNRINGSLSINDSQTITIGDLISTKMACPNSSVESTFMEAINNNKFTYTIENLILTLRSREHVLSFRKVD